MEKRISLEKRGRNPSEIKELVLDNCCSTSVVGLSDEFCNLESLSLINVGLTNLKGFPKLPNLKRLELSDNRISGGLNILSSNCPKVKFLHLGGNKIDNIDILEPLKELSDLHHLELTNCEVTSTENYREKIFKQIPNLKYLDGFDQNGEEIDDIEGENGTTDKWSGDEDEDSEKESEISEGSEDSEEGELGLAALQDEIDEESEGEDYNPDGEVSEDEEIEEDSDDAADSPDKEKRGEKRKLESDE